MTHSKKTDDVWDTIRKGLTTEEYRKIAAAYFIFGMMTATILWAVILK